MKTRKTKPLAIQSLIDNNILALEKANPKDRYPTIGFNANSQSWFAWNQTTCNSFRIGSRVNVGNCAYTEERGAWTALTLDDAKQMAIDFARNLA